MGRANFANFVTLALGQQSGPNRILLDDANRETEPRTVMPGSMTRMALRGRTAAGAMHGMDQGL